MLRLNRLKSVVNVDLESTKSIVLTTEFSGNVTNSSILHEGIFADKQ